MAAQHQEVRSMLTEEQRLKFDAMHQKMGKNRFNGERFRQGGNPGFRRGA